jgi:hypothetical protein
MRQFPLAALLAVAAAGLCPSAARAHKMELEVTVAGGVVRAVAGYEDGTPSEGAAVTLASAAGAVVASGTTDEKGVCELPRPPAGRYTVTANDHAGHKVTLTLDVPASEAEVSSSATAKRNRWLMTAAGLAAIAALTLALRRAVRRTG